MMNQNWKQNVSPMFSHSKNNQIIQYHTEAYIEMELQCICYLNTHTEQFSTHRVLMKENSRLNNTIFRSTILVKRISIFF